MTIQELIEKTKNEIQELNIDLNDELTKRFYSEIIDIWETAKNCYENKSDEYKALISETQNKAGVLFNFTYPLSDEFGEQINKVFFHLFQLARLIEISIYG